MIWWVSILLVSLAHLNHASPITIYATETNLSDYRLPEILTPSEYVLDLIVTEDVFEGTNTSFTGTVEITFQVDTNLTTDQIKINSEVEIHSISLSSSSGSISITSYDTYNETTQILVIEVGETLVEDVDYVLSIRYTGTFDTSTMHGFYLSSYENSNGSTEYLVTTQFESIYARQAFPSFDEPQYKARFTVSLTYPTGYNALSNTPQNGSTETVDSTYEKVTFEQTPIMPTYLLAFIVSKFTCTEGESIETGVPHQVCSRPESQSDRALAVELGPPLMRQLENITGIKYSSQMAKMDQVAIPDFASGAMENWGLVTYRETALLWNSNESSNTYKQRVATVVAHEFTHMWFGNLVTLKWWDYTFLNEGFARLYQYFAAAQIDELKDWELDKQFNVEQVHTALLADSATTSASLSSAALTLAEIQNKFSTISYNKGACIFRMVWHFLGEENYLPGLRSYLSTYTTKSVVPENLWSSLAEYAPSSVLPSGVNLSTVMTNWVDEPGYPVVMVTSDGNNVVLSQERFLLTDTDDTEWYTPITYTLSNDTSQFSDTSVKAWLIPGENLTLESVLDGNDWIILNNLETGYYRVNYDTSLWTQIKTVLKNDHETIDVLNRAQIVDDVLNLARAGHLQYSLALDVLGYLKNETDYYPWYPAITAVNLLLKRVGYESTLGEYVKAYMLELLQNLYDSVPFSTLDEDDQIYTLRQVLAITRACRLGNEDCISNAKELYAAFKNGTSVPKNLRAVVYCNALRHSDDIEEDFTFLWNHYQDTTLASEQVTILSNLGCTTNTTYLEWYLEQSINASSGIRIQDISYVWSSVYGSSTAGAELALEFLISNYERANNYSSVATYISSIADYFTTEDQLARLEVLAALDNLDSSAKSACESAINSTKTNLEWVENIKEDLTSFFEGSSSSSNVVHINALIFAVLLVLVKIIN